MNANYRRGRAAEYRIMRTLEGAGYVASRSAGSHGLFDVIAWNALGVRFIQSKVGAGRVTALDREAMREMARPANSTLEIWTFTPRVREPQIERVG